MGVLLAAILIVLVGDVFNGSSTPAGTGSGVAATQMRSLPPFTGIDLSGGNNITVRAGTRQSVAVHADRNLLGRITTDVRSGALVIGQTPGNLSARAPMFVDVTVPALDSITLRGAGNITVSGLDSTDLTIDLPGGGTIRATGTVRRLDVTVGGSGTVLLGGLIARDATAVLSGDGTIVLDATRSLDAKLSGTGTILYSGTPAHVTRSVTGTGTIQGS